MLQSDHRPPAGPLVDPGQIDHMAADMTVTFASDVTLDALQAKLAQHNQWLPIDGDSATPLGELVVHNSTGPLRLGYGAWRDVLLGAQLINGRGELVSVGGRVVKNVAGYDVTKFLVGSYGIFGTPLTFTTRTWRRPAGALHVSADSRRVNVGSLLTTPLRPHWAVLSSDGLNLGYHGDAATIAFCQSKVAAIEPGKVVATDLPADDSLRSRLWPSGPVFRASVPPAQIHEFVERAKLHQFAADPVFGIVTAPRDTQFEPELIRQTARAMGGTCVILAADGRPLDLPIDPPSYEILRQLKQAFDPDGKLPPLPPNRT